MTLSPDTLAWIERRCGGRIVDVEQQARWRPHHFVTLERSGETSTVLARSERDPGVVAESRFLSHFDIEHEARVLEALQGHGLKVPKFLGYDPQHRVILMERIEGTNLLASASDDAARVRIMKEYFEQLARLHSLDIEAMKLSDIEIPTTLEDVAFAGKFRFMEDDYRARRASVHPEPLLDLGIWWLHHNVPSGERRLSFLQGDTGPGQFMFTDHGLTALIDWELAHIGDPMLDLGVVRMRNMLYPTGPLREPIGHYEKVSGHPIDWPALGFYTVLSMLLTPMGLVESTQRPSAKFSDMIPRLGWDVTLRRGLCDALAEVLSLEIEPPHLPPPRSNDEPSLLDYLAEHLEISCAPVAHDDAERFTMNSALALARTLQLESRIGDELLADDLDDMAAVLERRPRDRAEGMARIAQLVHDRPDENLAALVSLFSRVERRREYRQAPLMIAQASGAFEPLLPAPDT